MRAELLSRLIGDAIQFCLANDGRGVIDPDANNSRSRDDSRAAPFDHRHFCAAIRICAALAITLAHKHNWDDNDASWRTDRRRGCARFEPSDQRPGLSRLGTWAGSVRLIRRMEKPDESFAGSAAVGSCNCAPVGSRRRNESRFVAN